MLYFLTILTWVWFLFFFNNKPNSEKFSKMVTSKKYLLITSALLLIAVAPMPYGYYQFIRIAITLVASINAFELYNKNKSTLLIVFVLISILYNPIIPIHFSKETWMPINLITAVFFGVVTLVSKNKEVGEEDV